MIPKVIHYCWFGGNPLPAEAKRCIDSWRKYLPEYEIKEWNESNFDIDCCDYVKEAYRAKKWAFVSDYVRFWIIFNYGGVYFDTDVEVIKPIDDILVKGAFMGLESTNAVNVATGLGIAANPGLGIAANPGLGIYKEILDSYKARHFINSDGSLNKTTVVMYVTDILNQHGFTAVNAIQEVCGITIYPTEYFCPKDYETGILNITSNTRSIHHFSASWHSEKEEYSHNLSKKMVKYIPLWYSNKIGTVIATLKYEGLESLLQKVVQKIK